MTNERDPSTVPGMLAADLGGTHLRAAVFDATGSIRSRVFQPTPPDDPGALVRALHRALDESDVLAAHAVVGVPGLVDYDAGQAVFLPQLPAWHASINAASLGEALGMPVAIANDADLAALGEHRFGAGVGTSHMVYVTCSTGVGAGVIVDGRLLRTRYSLGEVGHTIIDWRSGETVEQLGSGSALGAQTGEMATAIAARARDGDAEAARLFRDVADAFAVGVLTLIYCYQPERVVIGGGVSRTGDQLLDPVRERVRDAPNSVFPAEQIVQCATGDDAGLLGAYAFWLDQSGVGSR